MASNQSRQRRHRRSFGAIRQLASGNFQARYKDLSGKIELAPQTFATREAADNFLALCQADQIRSKEAKKSNRWIHDQSRGSITLEDYLKRYFQSKSNWSPKTRELNERNARQWILRPVGNYFLADKSLDSINPLMVREWYAELQKATQASAIKAKTPKPLNDSAAAKAWARKQGKKVEPLGRASQELLAQWKAAGCPQPNKLEISAEVSPPGRTSAVQTYTLLRTIFNSAVNDEFLERSPVREKDATKIRTRKARVAKVEQVQQLADLVPQRYKAAVLVAAYSGLRQGELFGLARKHFDFENNLIHVERATQKLQGQAAYIGATKTESSLRTVALPRTTSQALAAHMAKFTDPDPESLIFTTGTGKIVTSAALCAWFIPAREKAGLPNLTWHNLRNTGATLAAATGAPIKAIMNRLGHSSTRAALLYQALSLDDDPKIADDLERKIQSATIYRLDDFREATA